MSAWIANYQPSSQEPPEHSIVIYEDAYRRVLLAYSWFKARTLSPCKLGFHRREMDEAGVLTAHPMLR